METTNKRKFRIGEVYWMRFDGDASEQGGVRPGLVFQNNVGNEHSLNIIALPLTTSIKKRNQPTHVYVSANGTGLRNNSMVLCENPQRMSKNKVGDYITTLSNECMRDVAVAFILTSSVISFIDQDLLLKAWSKAVMLNK